MQLRKETIPKIILFIFLIIQVFAYTLSFLDIIYDVGTWQQSLIDSVYTVRNITFVLSIIIVFLFRRFTADDFVLVLFAFLSYVVMRFIFPENYEYFLEVQPIFIYGITSYVIVRGEFFDFEEIKRDFAVASRVVSLLLILTVIFNTDYLITHSVYMELANAMSIGLAILLYSGIIENKVYDLVISFIELFLLLVYGSRGSLLTLFILLIYLLWIKQRSAKKVVITAIILILVISFGPALLNNILSNLISAGFDSRSIQRILSGSFLISNDRVRIWKYLFTVIGKNLPLGTGICGDRYYLPKAFSGADATYAHNLFIEFFIDYGLLIGFFLSSVVIYLLVQCFFREKDIDRKAFFASFVTVAFLQLMFSRSFLTEQNFYILWGLLITFSTTQHLEIVFNGSSKYNSAPIESNKESRGYGT